ncbi:MAG TPA: flagellar biosynthetic protein FliO [Thermoleophilaceae bacterium]
MAGVLVPAHVALAKPSGPGENTPLNLPVQTTHSSSTPGASGGSLVHTFIGLAIVLAVIYGLYWVLKQVKASREERSSGQGLSSVATLALGPNRSVHLVKSGREYVLVGASENGVTPIRTYSEEEAHDAGLVPDPVESELEAPLPARPQKSGILIKDVLDEIRRRTVRK